MRRIAIAGGALAAILTVPADAGSRYMIRSAVAAGQPVGTRIVAPPTGLGHVPPFVVTRRPDGSYRHTFDVTTRRPTPTVTIYAGPGGNNDADCLSWATRCRSLKQTLVRASAQPASAVIRVLAQAGIYRSTDVDGAGIPDDFGSWLGARNLVIEPTDASGNPLPPSNGQFTRAKQVVSSHEVAMPAFAATSDPRVFVSTYTTETPDNGVWDEKHANRFGRPLGLMAVPPDAIAATANPVAEINRMAETFGKGAFFLDKTAKKLWVRLSDGRAPDADLRVSAAGRQLYFSTTNAAATFAVYMRNVDQWGGYFQQYSGATDDWNFTFVDTYSGYITNGAFLFSASGSFVWERSVVSDYWIDAFGTAVNDANPKVALWYELDTIAEYGGNRNAGDNSANASTEHRNSVGIAVNTVYRYNNGRFVHDIGNARSWRVGMTIGPSTRVPQAASGLVGTVPDSAVQGAVGVASGYYDETGPQDTKIWVDGLKIVGPMTYALGAYNNSNGGGAGGTLMYRNLKTADGVGNTTTSPYPGQTSQGVIRSD